MELCLACYFFELHGSSFHLRLHVLSAMAEKEAETVLTTVESPTSDTVLDSESDPVLNQCECCAEKTETDKLFKCLTCDKESDSSGAATYYCDACIAPHAKKGHEIVDHKSHKPALCSDHRSICSLFCTSCDVLLCMACVAKHNNHSIMSLKEKASEIRSEVFDKLSELEQNEKCVRETKARLTENRDTYRTGYEDLVQNVSFELDKIKQKILNRIKVEHENVMEVGTESEGNLELLLKSEKDLRDLLSQSDGQMVSKYPDVKNQIGTVNETQQKLTGLKIEHIKHKFDADEFVTAAQDVLNRCSERIEMPLLKSVFNSGTSSKSESTKNINSESAEVVDTSDKENLSDDHFVYLRNCESIYSVYAVDNEVFVSEIKFIESKEHDSTRTVRTVLGKYTCPEKVEKLLVYPHLSSHTIYTQTDQFDLAFEIRSKTFKYFNLQHVSNPDQLLVISDDSEYQYKWNWEKKTITGTDTCVDGSILCILKPTVKMTYYDNYWSHFVTIDNDILSIKTHGLRSTLRLQSIILKESVHKVKQIDAVSRVNERILIWSLLTKNITMLNANSTQVECVVPFGSEFTYFSIPLLGANVQFLVKAKLTTSQNKLEDKEVFMVRKLK